MKTKALFIRMQPVFTALAIIVLAIGIPSRGEAGPAGPDAPVDPGPGHDATMDTAAEVASKAVSSLTVSSDSVRSIFSRDSVFEGASHRGLQTSKDSVYVRPRNAINLATYKWANRVFFANDVDVTLYAEGEGKSDDLGLPRGPSFADTTTYDRQIPPSPPEEPPGEEEQPPEFQNPEEDFEETMEGSNEEYEEGEKYKKRYPKGKYRTTVVVSEGRVLVAPYDERGPQYAKAVSLSGGKEYIVEGEIK